MFLVLKKLKSTDRNILEEIIRVDHAGEYGATKIYDGQISIFGKTANIRTPLIGKYNL